MYHMVNVFAHLGNLDRSSLTMAIPINVGDNMRIILKGTSVLGEDDINVFHYNFYAGSGTDVGSHLLENFAFGFWENIKAPLRALCSNLSKKLEVECQLLDADFDPLNGESFIIPVGEQAGLSSNEAMPPFVTLTYRYVRPDFTFRHGFKRFGSLTEIDFNAGIPAVTRATQHEALRVALEADIGGLYPDGTPLADPPDARPIVYRRVLNNTPISPALWGIPIGVTGPKAGSQNSRKQGKGS